ncbi:baseplate J/gp47 family protein [Pseudodesulfovibrio indicus]|uniref:Baseplate J protein n=1 Tax=Pseudodesulfovibrio indicus TaxID=1716143 RepID=A0A140D8Z1_9BACT|nr:baseplate J/gp47 family protein [Pseudodesulfovibrio indicus]AMK09658.1 baseplate J protein [Pseudodesulfovibrio indicus]TDT86390.1 putative phage protein gp47/JayE [Pseudodesulfovibrio indicus]
MPFDRPSLSDLISRVKADIESRLAGADASQRRTLLGILAVVEAGAVHGLYGYLDWIAAQGMPDTADAEQLERWASIWGKQRKSAASATGLVTFTGSDGSVIPTGTVVSRSDGLEFSTTEDGTIAAGSAAVAVTAVEAGADANTAAGVKLKLVSALSGVQSTAVAGELSGGADVEGDGDLRSRLLARIRQAPHGGADFDYVAWALEVSGVTRAWVYPLELGAGTVTVRVMTDGTTEDGIPAAETVDAVQTYLDAARPVTAEVFVVAPVAVPMDPAISISPNTEAVQAAIEAELGDMLLRAAEPGATIRVSHLREAISIATGEADHVLLSPAADVAHAVGEVATLGTITWSDL